MRSCRREEEPDLPEEGGRPRRVAGAEVVLVDGRWVLFVERGGRRWITARGVGEECLIKAVQAWCGARSRRRARVERVNGEPVEQTPTGELLRGLGWAMSPRGLVWAP